MYHNKYLKYKQKYLNLIGGVDELDNEEINSLVIPTELGLPNDLKPIMNHKILDQTLEIYIKFK